MKQKRVGRPRFERLPNVVPVASLTDETDLSLLFAQSVNKTTENRPRPTYAAVTRKYRELPFRNSHLKPRKTDVWRTADNRPVCFHCGRPGHVMRHCRERKAVFDNPRNRRRNLDDVGTEEEIRRPNSSRRFTPSPTRGRSSIRRYRSPSPYRRSSQSPGRSERGKLRRATFQGGEAAQNGKSSISAKMTGNQPDGHR
ncbi:CCHC-type domain-containing protein [Trichonephila clavipes]|nr:CCHC-type domain-containing protein [Trichonephila clavipes]